MCYVRVCVCICVCVHVRVCVCTCTCACVFVCMRGQVVTSRKKCLQVKKMSNNMFGAANACTVASVCMACFVPVAVHNMYYIKKKFSIFSRSFCALNMCVLSSG